MRNCGTGKPRRPDGAGGASRGAEGPAARRSLCSSRSCGGAETERPAESRPLRQELPAILDARLGRRCSPRSCAVSSKATRSGSGGRGPPGGTSSAPPARLATCQHPAGSAAFQAHS